MAFQESLSSEKRKYPKRAFEVFWNAAKRYAELTRSDPLIHRAVAEAVSGLVDFPKQSGNASCVQETHPSLHPRHHRGIDGQHFYDMVLTSYTVVSCGAGMLIAGESCLGHIIQEPRFGIDAEAPPYILLTVVDGCIRLVQNGVSDVAFPHKLEDPALIGRLD